MSQELKNKISTDLKEQSLNDCLLAFLSASKGNDLPHFFFCAEQLREQVKNYTKKQLEDICLGRAMYASFGPEHDYEGMSACKPFISPEFLGNDEARKIIFKIYGKTFYGMDDAHNLNSYLYYSLVTFCATNKDEKLARKVFKEFILYKHLKVKHPTYSMIFFRSTAFTDVLTNAQKNKIISFVCEDLSPREKYFSLGSEASSFAVYLRFSKDAYLKLLNWSGEMERIISSKKKSIKIDFAKEQLLSIAFNVKKSLIFSTSKINTFFKLMNDNGVIFLDKDKIAVIEEIRKKCLDKKTHFNNSIILKHLKEQDQLLFEHQASILKSSLEKNIAQLPHKSIKPEIKNKI